MSSPKVYWVTDHSDDVSTHHLFTTVHLSNPEKDKALANMLGDLCPHSRAIISGRFVPLHRVQDGIDAHEFVEAYEKKVG